MQKITFSCQPNSKQLVASRLYYFLFTRELEVLRSQLPMLGCDFSLGQSFKTRTCVSIFKHRHFLSLDSLYLNMHIYLFSSEHCIHIATLLSSCQNQRVALGRVVEHKTSDPWVPGSKPDVFMAGAHPSSHCPTPSPSFIRPWLFRSDVKKINQFARLPTNSFYN